MRPLVWVTKSLEKLAMALMSRGFPVGIDTVRTELRKLGFSRQGDRKAEEGSNHADRDAQFRYINATVLAAQERGEPVVSVDTKKKGVLQRHERSSP
jgi:Rhodopirellula transposase DDE domain